MFFHLKFGLLLLSVCDAHPLVLQHPVHDRSAHVVQWFMGEHALLLGALALVERFAGPLAVQILAEQILKN